jgi:hypothetical protein
MRYFVNFCAVLLLSSQYLQAQSNSVEVWMRAFIPNPANAAQGAGHIIPMPNGASGSLVRLLPFGPSVPNECFATDDRGFSNSGGSTSRLETRFTLSLASDGTPTVLPAQNRTTAGMTRKVDCATGETLLQHPGTVDQDFVGAPAVADGIVQVIGQAQGSNILSLAGKLAPAVDYNFDIQWKPSTNTLVASISFGSFPAFEMYARQPGGSWVSVIQQLPTGRPWNLGGDGFGLNTERRSVTVNVPGITGRWQSPAPQRRFTVEFRGAQVRWSERNTAGAVLTRDVPIRELPDGTFRIERPNDAAVLDFLGFQPTLRGQILARNPQPSYMILSLSGAELNGDWYGLLVTKDENAQLKELFQPGTRPPTRFLFARVP